MSHYFIVKVEEKRINDLKQFFEKYKIKAELVAPLKCSKCKRSIEPNISISKDDMCRECAWKILEHMEDS